MLWKNKLIIYNEEKSSILFPLMSYIIKLLIFIEWCCGEISYSIVGEEKKFYGVSTIAQYCNTISYSMMLRQNKL
jgi:hypothetical protein